MIDILNQEMICSLAIIGRIEALEADVKTLDEDAAFELEVLNAIALEGEDSPDWPYGEVLIRDDYFVEHIKDLIKDCYELEEENTQWPYNHLTMDWETAAEEAKADYITLAHPKLQTYFYIRA